MNKIKMALYAILLISFFSTFTSCNGQNNSKTQEEKTIEIGITVPRFDKTIWAIYPIGSYVIENPLAGTVRVAVFCFGFLNPLLSNFPFGN
jgi:hypothetical protein